MRGYHVYKDVWEATHGEVLNCTRETGNAFDPFAVSVIKRGNVVGHVPRKISAICSLFMRRGGTIHCKATGSRKYSRDISQGGLEIPCLQIFTGDPKYIQKVKKAISSASTAAKSKVAISKSTKEVGGKDEVKNEVKNEDVIVEKKPAKRAKLNSTDSKEQTDEEVDQNANMEWVRIFNIVLNISDIEILSVEQELTDTHMNVAQKLILHQFPTYQGLKNTLLNDSIGFWTNNYIQIMHCGVTG